MSRTLILTIAALMSVLVTITVSAQKLEEHSLSDQVLEQIEPLQEASAQEIYDAVQHGQAGRLLIELESRTRQAGQVIAFAVDASPSDLRPFFYTEGQMADEIHTAIADLRSQVATGPKKPGKNPQGFKVKEVRNSLRDLVDLIQAWKQHNNVLHQAMAERHRQMIQESQKAAPPPQLRSR